MAYVKKISISGTQYDVKDIEALQKVDQYCLMPNFGVMTPVQTVEFDTSDTNWHTIFTRTNTETSHIALDDIIYFRMTVTGTNINHICDCVFRLEGRLDTPTLVAFLKPGTTDANYCGIRYIRLVYPKALNSGYNWAFEVLQNRNSNARHYKVEVFKTNSKITWTQGTASIYNGTYHNYHQPTFETNSGYYINSFVGTISQSSWASALNSYLNKFVTFSTSPLVAEAILANQMVFMNSNKFYPASNKTVAIEPGCGIQFCSIAYAVNNAIGWDRIRQKVRISSLTNIPHATLARGNPCYFRCTLDSNGNILSDNYVSTTMDNGYTWYYLGVAEDANCFSLDTTQSFFITLDSNGNITHINGKKTTADTSDCVKLTGDQTISGNKLFLNKIALGDTTSHLGSIELFGGNQNYGGFFDFHYKDSTADYTSRIIEDGSGQLSINGATFPLNASGAKLYAAPTEDNTSSKQIDTVGARNTALNNKIQLVSVLPVTPTEGVLYLIAE